MSANVEEFHRMALGRRDALLVRVNAQLDEALRDDNQSLATVLRKQRQYLQTLETHSEFLTCATGAEMLAFWPVEFGALPLWIHNPTAAVELDPPGSPCVLICQAAGQSLIDGSTFSSREEGPNAHS